MGKSRVQVPQEAGIFLVFQEPRLLLLDQPTKGVDIGAKAEIHDIVRALAAGSDVAAIVVSSEDEEVLAISCDVVVFHEGTCDGTIYEPIDLKVGDLRRLAWTPSESTVGSRR
jgi:ABC-type sugar transport system ATPase subunit